VRAATDGAFRFLALPPGAYYIAAVTDLDPLQLYDEAFLSELAAAAIPVTLGDGEKKVQELVMK
jgi:hypothetical protein